MALTPKGDIILTVPPDRLLLVNADSDGDGYSDGVSTLLDGLHNASGLFLDGDQLYVAEVTRVLRVGFDTGRDESPDRLNRSFPCRAGACTGRARSRRLRTVFSM
jgi:hypothetical protein